MMTYTVLDHRGTCMHRHGAKVIRRRAYSAVLLKKPTWLTRQLPWLVKTPQHVCTVCGESMRHLDQRYYRHGGRLT